MYEVRENGKLCDCNNFPVHTSWNNAKFVTYLDALLFVNNWLGIYAPTITPKFIQQLQNGYKYNGYDTIQIVETE